MSLPKSVDLRPIFDQRGLPPRVQGKRGTGSLFALIGVLEFEYAAQGENERFSVEFLNWASHQTNQANGHPTDGSCFSGALEGLCRYGVCEESLFPYAAKFDAALTPSSEALANARRRCDFSVRRIKEWDASTGLTSDELDAIRHCLADGHPVAVGLRWPKKPHYLPGQRLYMPHSSEAIDAHSVVLVGYVDDPKDNGGGTFLFRNASGPEWGDGGYGRFSYAYALTFTNDAAMLFLAP